MKVYFQVLSSIIISLIAWSVVIGLPLVFIGLDAGTSDPFQLIFIPLIVSFFGLVLYGFLGSLIWIIVFLLVKNINVPEFIKHILSASFSTLVTPIFLSFTLFGLDYSIKVWDMYSITVLIIPVVIVSLFVYKKGT